MKIISALLKISRGLQAISPLYNRLVTILYNLLISLFNYYNFLKYILKRTLQTLRYNEWGVLLTKNRYAFNNKRLLIVYDLSSQPFSIGDILVFQEASLVLMEVHSLVVVDIAIVYDPGKPASPDPAFSSIDSNNYMFHLASILPVAQVNPYLGSLFLFNSHFHLERFVAENHDRYYVWPDASNYSSKQYLYFKIFNKLLFEHYTKYHSIPSLNSRPNMMLWAYLFLNRNIFPSIPVTVQLRRNTINKARDSNYDSWLEFFNYCRTRYPVKFIVICSESEIDERFRNYSNVILSKDFHTDIEHDLALINVSAFHMGASSGPGAIALFSPKPFLFVNTDLNPNDYKGMLREGNVIRFFFSGPLQNFIFGQETTELLITEFEKIWAAIDKAYWDSLMKESVNYSDNRDLYTWLR